MKTLQLPDEIPMILVTRFCRENGMSINWLGNGVYRASRAADADPLSGLVEQLKWGLGKVVVSDERIKAE